MSRRNAKPRPVITAIGFNVRVFDLRDDLWAGAPETMPDPPLRLTGWRGEAYELLSRVLDLTAAEVVRESSQPQ